MRNIAMLTHLYFDQPKKYQVRIKIKGKFSLFHEYFGEFM